MYGGGTGKKTGLRIDLQRIRAGPQHLLEVVKGVDPYHRIVGRCGGWLRLRLIGRSARLRSTELVHQHIPIGIDGRMIEGKGLVLANVEVGPFLKDRAGIAFQQSLFRNVYAIGGAGAQGIQNILNEGVAAAALIGQGVPVFEERQVDGIAIGSAMGAYLARNDEALELQVYIQRIIARKGQAKVIEEGAVARRTEHADGGRVVELRYAVNAIAIYVECDFILVSAQAAVGNFPTYNVGCMSQPGEKQAAQQEHQPKRKPPEPGRRKELWYRYAHWKIIF